MKKNLWIGLSGLLAILIVLLGNHLWNLKIDSRIERQQLISGPYFNLQTTGEPPSSTAPLITGSITSTNLYVSGLTNLAGALTFSTANGTSLTSTNAFFTTLASTNLTPTNISATSISTTNFNVSSGKVGIGSSTPLTKLAVVGDVNISNIITNIATDNLVCVSATGTLSQESVSCTVSSARFKDNIMSLSSKTLLKEVQKLRAVSFDYKAKDLNGFNQIPEQGLNGGGKESIGFIAEEVALIDPMLVSYTSDFSLAELAFEKQYYPKAILIKNGKTLIPKTVDYARVSVVLIGALQNIDERLQKLEK